MNSNLLSKYSYWIKISKTVLLRAREIALRTREIRQNCRFLCVRRAVSRARERHVAEFRVACCIYVLLRRPKKQF